MEITFRDLMTVMHGMGFGALFMLAFSGAIAELYRMTAPNPQVPLGEREQRIFHFYLATMVILAWLAVLSGAYIVYPWYRAVPPAGITDLANYPQRFLMASPTTTEWHGLGMEWKEHVAWMAPIAMTMVAYIFKKYGSAISRHREIRKAVLTFAIIAFLATGVAGAFGAFLNKYAPIRGGASIILMEGK